MTKSHAGIYVISIIYITYIILTCIIYTARLTHEYVTALMSIDYSRFSLFSSLLFLYYISVYTK
jgi:hypothetical protein